MPKRTHTACICVTGARPIVIGQTRDFGYSGTALLNYSTGR